jgi:hypothetical protein
MIPITPIGYAAHVLLGGLPDGAMPVPLEHRAQALQLCQEVLVALDEQAICGREVADPTLAVLGVPDHRHLGHLVDNTHPLSLVKPCARCLNVVKLRP